MSSMTQQKRIPVQPATKNKSTLDRPGQPPDALRARILQDRREKGLAIPKEYGPNRETRPKENVDRGERPTPQDNPRMSQSQVGQEMESTGYPQGDLASADDPSYDTAPFAPQAVPTVTAAQRRRKVQKKDIYPIGHEVEQWRGLLGNDYKG